MLAPTMAHFPWALLAALAVAGCSALPFGGTRPASEAPPTAQSTNSPTPAPTATSGAASTRLPLCNDVPYVAAPAHYYRDTPVYVANEMPTDVLRQWASTKPGFVEMWIDREHNGWITLAFSADAEARQQELENEFPGVGVVAVTLKWKVGELEALQRRVSETFRRHGASHSSGIYPNKGVVSIDLAVLKPELVALAEQEFGSDPVCLNGMDPADAPVEGPQPQAGNGWRLLADEDLTGEPYRTGIAFDDDSYIEVWAEARLEGERPPVDFESEVVIWFGAVHGSSCPRLRLDHVAVAVERSIVHSVITYLDTGMCTGDARPHAYVVALERSRLPQGPFSIQLDSADPPRGAIDSRTIVEVDLSTPGAIAQPGAIHPDTSDPGPQFLGPGDFVEDGFPADYRQSTHCGLEWLGPLNDVNWRTEAADGQPDWIPTQWNDSTDETIELRILLTTGPPLIKATANRHSVIYEATSDQPPGCD